MMVHDFGRLQHRCRLSQQVILRRRPRMRHTLTLSVRLSCVPITSPRCVSPPRTCPDSHDCSCAHDFDPWYMLIVCMA